MDVRRLLDLATRLAEYSIVPGMRLPPPQFGPTWSAEDVASLRGTVDLPAAFEELVLSHGGISAMDTAGGVAFLTARQIIDHLHQDYGRLLRAVGPVAAFPLAVNGSGSYLLLASDDSAVWKLNAHMHPVATPRRIAEGFQSFLDALGDDWHNVLAGNGGPYATS